MKFLGALTGSVVVFVLEVWLSMLVIGAAHAADERVPALGWGAVAWLVVLVNIVTGVTVDNMRHAQD